MVLRNAPHFTVFFLATAALTLAGCLAPDALPGAGGSGGAGGGSAGGAGGAGGGSTSLELAWAHAYGIDSDNDQRAWSISATPGRDALVAGEFRGSFTMGSLPTLPNTEGRDAFVAQLDPTGDPAWIMGFVGLGEQRVYRAIATPDGGYVVAGAFTQSLTFAEAERGDSPNGEDGFIASIDDKQTLRWLVHLAGPGTQTVNALALSPHGGVLVAGHFDDTLEVGDLVISGDADTLDFFVAKLGEGGEPLWATSLGGDPAQLDPGQPACHLAAAADGGVHIAGSFVGTMLLDENLGAIGTRDVFVARLDPAGVPLWGHTLGAPERSQRASALALDAQGRTLLAGDLDGEVTFDGTTLSAEGDATDAFLAVLDDAGQLAWARRYGSFAVDHADAATFDASGNILLAGRFRGSIAFGDEAPLLGSGAVSDDDDIFLAKLTPDGAPIFSRAFGGDGDQVPTSLAVDAEDALLLVGYFDGILDFGDGPLDALAGDDLFAVKLEQ